MSAPNTRSGTRFSVASPRGTWRRRHAPSGRAAAHRRQRDRRMPTCSRYVVISSTPSAPARHAERRDGEQRLDLGRAARRTGRRSRRGSCSSASWSPAVRDPPVELQAERLLRDPPRRDERLHRQVDPELLLFRHRLALQLGDRLRQDPRVGVEPDGRDVPVLLGAQHVAGAADLEVAQRDLEPAPERLVLARSSPGARAPPRSARVLGGKKKYANARSAERPTRPRSWYICARPSRSARSTISVFAFGTSRPLSMIVVQTSTSASRSQNRIICLSSSSSSIWPCATTMRASGSCSCSHAACRSIVATRLWTQNTWPSRRSSRRTAPSARPSS